jgi:hypothetical protein
MQFSKLEVKPRYIMHAISGTHIEREPVCSCCHARPVAGYVVGTGQFLKRTCLKCYRAAGREGRSHEELIGMKHKPSGKRAKS